MIEQIKKYFADRALYRLTVDELSSLSDRELNDLQMSRCDIDRIARDTVWGAQAAVQAPTSAKPLQNRRAFA